MKYEDDYEMLMEPCTEYADDGYHPDTEVKNGRLVCAYCGEDLGDAKYLAAAQADHYWIQ